MPEEQEIQKILGNKQEENIEITDKMIRDLVKDILELEKDNLYVNRANLKEQIVTFIKTRVR